MVDFKDLNTSTEIAALLVTFTGISAGEVRDLEEGEFFKPADKYLVDWSDCPMVREGIGNDTNEAYNTFTIYIKATSQNDLLIKASYIAKGCAAVTTANTYYEFSGVTPLGRQGKDFLGSCTITQVLSGVANNYTV